MRRLPCRRALSGPGADDRTKRHRHNRQPADRSLGRRRFFDAARVRQRADPGQSAARSSTEFRRSARRLAATDPAGWYGGLQGLDRFADAGHDDMSGGSKSREARRRDGCRQFTLDQ